MLSEVTRLIALPPEAHVKSRGMVSLPVTDALNLRYPVLLIHGLFSSSRTWKKTVRALSADFDLRYGGEVSARSGDTGPDKQPADFYTWNFSSNRNLSYRQQAQELCTGIEEIRRINRCDKVALVGHSMGGLAARAVIQLMQQPGIHALITLGTPHYGSPLALLRESTQSEARRLIGRVQKLLGKSERASEEKPGFFRRLMMKLFHLSSEAQAEVDAFFSSEAFIELAPGSAALEELNTQPLPAEVHYAFITGSLTNFSAFTPLEQKARYAKIRRLFVEATERVTHNLADKYLAGTYSTFREYVSRYLKSGSELTIEQLMESDGAVPVVSQILAHFKNPPPVAAVLPVYASHTRLTKRPAKIFQALAVCGVVGPRQDLSRND